MIEYSNSRIIKPSNYLPCTLNPKPYTLQKQPTRACLLTNPNFSISKNYPAQRRRLYYNTVIAHRHREERSDLRIRINFIFIIVPPFESSKNRMIESSNNRTSSRGTACPITLNLKPFTLHLPPLHKNLAPQRKKPPHQRHGKPFVAKIFKSP